MPRTPPEKTPKALMLFVDGLGLGDLDPAYNPLVTEACPTLRRLLREEAVPIDACLGVPGPPQSATGQTALLTGLNAAQILGRHAEGFPNAQLRALIQEHNLFSRLKAKGLRSTFANAYYMDDFTRQALTRRPSVTTVATLAAFGAVRDREAMERHEAVFQDLTRTSLRARGYPGPLIEPEEAAMHLVALARQHDFTLFEYFQTDRAAHRGTREEILQVLGLFDRFLQTLLPFAREPRGLLLLVSDHGNIEDLRTRSHTTNPVPWVALGQGATALREEVRTLTDIVPALLAQYETGPAPTPRRR